MRPSRRNTIRSANASGSSGPLLGDDDRAAVRARVLEQRLGGVAVELRRRLVEEQQLGLERESRREADALQLAARELGDGALGEVLGADRGERRARARHDLVRRRAEVLEPERHLGEHARQHDLVLGLLEHGRHGPGEVRGPRRSRVAPADDDASGETAAVEVRHEPGERAQQASTCPIRTLRAARRTRRGSISSDTPPSAGRVGARIREGHVLDRR